MVLMKEAMLYRILYVPVIKVILFDSQIIHLKSRIKSRIYLAVNTCQ